MINYINTIVQITSKHFDIKLNIQEPTKNPFQTRHVITRSQILSSDRMISTLTVVNGFNP